MLIKVTKEIIEEAVEAIKQDKSLTTFCPLAIAFRKTFNNEDIRACIGNGQYNFRYVIKYFDKSDLVTEYPLPKEANILALRFDQYYIHGNGKIPPEPIDFEFDTSFLSS